MSFLKNLYLIDEDDKLARCIPDSVLVENYVHLQILLGRYDHHIRDL